MGSRAPKLLGVLLLSLALWFSGAASISAASPCPENFAQLAGENKLSLDFNITGAHIDSVMRQLKESGQIPDNPGVFSLLRYVLENATQHGVEDMYAGELAHIRVRVIHGADHVDVQVTNQLYKKFPERLARTFAPGEKVELTQQERPWPRGFGVGLPQVFREFEKFPAGSLMRWQPDGQREVTFTLRIPRE